MKKKLLNKQIKRTKGELEREIEALVGKDEFKNFKKFAFKGQMVDLSVAFILGAAFRKVVGSISDNLIMPLLNFIISKTGDNWREYTYSPVENLNFELGKFAGAFVDFLLIAIILYIVYQKIISGMLEDKAKVVCLENIKCPYCYSVIYYKCTKCPHCTSEIE